MLEMMSPGRRLGAGLRDEDVAALARNGGLRLGFNARRVGMSGLSLDPSLDYPDPVVDNGDYYPGDYPQPSNSSIWSAQLPTLIGLGLRDLRDIFAPTQTSQADYRSQQPAQQYYPQTVGGGVPRTTTAFSAGTGGVNFLGAQISWPIVIIAGLILFFPGFSRRRNPGPSLRCSNPRPKRKHVKRARRRR